jgi:hypothetical protein
MNISSNSTVRTEMDVNLQKESIRRASLVIVQEVLCEFIHFNWSTRSLCKPAILNKYFKGGQCRLPVFKCSQYASNMSTSLFEKDGQICSAVKQA